jgi:glutamate--cysteine ligase
MRTRGAWEAAAHDGLSDPALRDAADRCFRAVLDALPRLGTDRATIDAVAAYHDRYVARGRCPADDALHGWLQLQAALA